MGEESYREVLIAERGKVLPHNHPLTRMVDGVLQRLVPQVPIEGADWKVHVIKDDSMLNAFVLPGYVLLGLWCVMFGRYVTNIVLFGLGERYLSTRVSCPFVKTKMD